MSTHHVKTYAGITSNPALGYAADLLIKNGGTAILAETPEIYGAEHLLTRRAINKKVGNKLVERISFPEAVRDAYMLVATSCHTKKIISVRVI